MTKYVSILNGGTNNHQVSAADFNYLATDFIGNGVVGAVTNTSGTAPTTGSFAVNAQSTPNTTTQVSPGTGYITATPLSSVSQTFRVNDTVGTTITHAANTSGATRYDWIYVQLDPTALANPSLDGSSPLLYTVSRSTSNTTDTGTPPTYAIPVAIVTLTNTFASVTNGNIADKRVQSVVNSIPGTNNYSYNSFYNPYKFSAYRNAAQNTGSGAFAKVNFDTKLFDTGSNFDNTTNFRFTAPIAGFYQFNSSVSTAANVTAWIISFYKNGVEFSRGTKIIGGANPEGVAFSDLLQLAAGDYVEVFIFSSTAVALEVGATAPHASFSGYLMSTT